MNDFSDASATGEMIERIGRLQAGQAPLWGKMNAAQMLAHCQASFTTYFGQLKLKGGLMGYLLGPIMKRSLYSKKPWPRNLPTAKEFVIADACDLEKERARLIALIYRMAADKGNGKPPRHPFFGRMSVRDWNVLAYRHLDHHLQQFGQ